ncbi:GNAT family N-acetyltransferase [Rhizobium calliandrae]|uniref:GNAT family N-acetyltransferase n=1 Tax=Rhizobium calliandrae TaxID=1312182 RepID=A0ABT7KDY4_9HYPH|nr:GNAT family N-acetyltransferase [Rhizobium calliandrae]MDL2406829.1 GNAT family N-acetyltransferase [Rhizobium calliandrae]
MEDEEQLDNPIWYSLATQHANLGEARGMAARYMPSIARFAGLQNGSESAFADLADITLAGDTVALFTARTLQVPSNWTLVRHRQIDQMICLSPPPLLTVEAEKLTEADVPEMVSLVEATEPGPFGNRTIEMGDYFGIRSDDGSLIAMAGERLSLSAFVEISAVCTHPDYRGKGLAKGLISLLANRAYERGRASFLHVKTENEARLVYTKLGFSLRTAIDLTVLTRQ